MKRILLLLLLSTFIPLATNAQSKKSTDKTQQTLLLIKDSGLKNNELSEALKEALSKGVTEKAKNLGTTDGFYKNDTVKIIMPDLIKPIDEKLRKMGMGALMDEGLLLLNRAAEDALKEGSPIFTEAIAGMTIKDPKTVLAGGENAATSYMIQTTAEPLYTKFSKVVKVSLAKVGADEVWKQILGKYNTQPLVNKINPDLVDYVTSSSMRGVYRMVAVQEKNIRTDLASRTSDLMKKVFALQD
jgi:hypothetical protein